MIRPAPSEVVDREWIQFPGGELEGVRPRALCQACRDRMKQPDGAEAPRSNRRRNGASLLCFQCYRAELDRERALKAAGELDTASEERFQTGLPFERVDVPRLERLRADRSAARVAFGAGSGRFANKRRQAQIAARHALHRIAAGLRGVQPALDRESRNKMADAVHAAELQLPDAWLPFVMSR
jgi:hypothetical protein